MVLASRGVGDITPIRKPQAPPRLVIPVVVAAILLCFLNAAGIVNGLGAITQGERVADAVVGMLLVVAPPLLALGFERLWGQHIRFRGYGFYFLALLGPALTLLPYFRGADINPDIIRAINRKLPDIHLGLLVGEMAVLAGGAYYITRKVVRCRPHNSPSRR